MPEVLNEQVAHEAYTSPDQEGPVRGHAGGPGGAAQPAVLQSGWQQEGPSLELAAALHWLLQLQMHHNKMRQEWLIVRSENSTLACSSSALVLATADAPQRHGKGMADGEVRQRTAH